MVRAKNYETMSTFVKVMQKKLWPLFFRTRCIVRLGLPHSDAHPIHVVVKTCHNRLHCAARDY